MGAFKDLGIRHSYTGKGSKILKSFLLPVLDCSVSYDRVTSFYTIDSLIAISQGIDSLFERRGKMRLIIGVHSFPEEIAEAELRRKHMSSEIDAIRKAVTEGFAKIEDELVKKRVATIAWMIDDGLLEVKVASVEGEGLFHPKTLVFEDDSGDKIAAVGSSNETGSGLGGNFEQLMVALSWEAEDAVQDQIDFFESLWSNESEDAIVECISEDLAKAIILGLGSSYAKPNHSEEAKTLPSGSLLAEAMQMPANFFVSGHVPALFQHQERAVIDALSRWPVRVLFADEVGLGKTFEAGATMAYLMRYGGVKRAVILTPKAVLQQWQDELYEHFGINAWLFDSNAKQYVDCTGKTIPMGSKNPIGKGSPDIALISAQLARGGAGRKNIFERSGAVMPDLLMLDEAHSARVRKDISGSTKSTKMYEMIKEVSQRIPHLILATATPMQKDPGEYHSMLKLLGIPKSWQKPRAYNASLRLIAADVEPDSNDAYTAGKLVRSTISMMKPSLEHLDQEELAAIAELLSIDREADSYDVAMCVQSNWAAFRRAFVKLHPGHLLTIRNTRRALERVGYVFPKRNLIEESIGSSSDVQLFYVSVNEYIKGFCFSVERAVNPDKKMNIGFIRANYQQRVASSLHSCRKSLERRLAKILGLKAYLDKTGKLGEDYASAFSFYDEIDDIDEDELLSAGSDFISAIESSDAAIDLENVAHAIELESTSITPLIARIDGLLEKHGDMKIERSISVAMKHLSENDRVLLFSRYTDTVDALIEEFKKTPGSDAYAYGIYIGQKSVVVKNGKEQPCSKEEIKKGLRTGDINLMFCSDAASEGLNLQAARVLINVDVPWTPARLEQRIGRVARLGQQAAEVDIHNVWYPSSIEAKMYHRIQKRLDDTNLAIGEFPEVVAESIKNAILDDSEMDNSAEELQEIRFSAQTKALEELWSSSVLEKTTSSVVRERLIEIIEQESPSASFDEQTGLWSFTDADGVPFEATATDGCDESVSYSMAVQHGVDFESDGFMVVLDGENRPCAFTGRGSSGTYIEHESIPGFILGNPVQCDVPVSVRPNMLPNPSAMALSFVLDEPEPPMPKLWLEGEADEN
jgi:superfamily II DNA or RNA helicase